MIPLIFSLQPSVMLKIWTEEFLSVSILGADFYTIRQQRVRTRETFLFVLTCKLLFQTISKLDPKFIALHCQEVGGKNYEQSMRHVEDFVR